MCLATGKHIQSRHRNKAKRQTEACCQEEDKY